MYQRNRPFVVPLLAAAVTACGSAQMYGNRLHEVQYAAWAAEDAGAADHPRAARLLRSARLELMRARHVADNGDEENAALLLDRSEADAQLALQLTRTANQQQEAEDAWVELQNSELEQP